MKTKEKGDKMEKFLNHVKGKKSVIIACIIIVFSATIIALADYIDPLVTPLENDESQYMELKLVETKDIAGSNDKQLVFEWWAYNLEFNNVYLRFSYDTQAVVPADVSSGACVR